MSQRAAAWSLRCQRLFLGTLFTVFEFVAALVSKLRVWLHLQNPALPRAELRPYLDNLLDWRRTRRLGAQWRSPKGPRPVLSLTAELRTEWKKQKYAQHMEQTLTALVVPQEKGWDVMFTDGSSKRVRGWEQAGFGGFYGEGDERNFACPLDPQEVQTNGRAEVRAVLFAMRQCTGSRPMAIVTDSEFCFDGLAKHILLWERRDWPGISHSNRWVQILGLARDSSGQYKFFWVRSHVSIEGNEGADRQAEEGRLLHEYNLQPLQKRQRLNPPEVSRPEDMGRGGREMTPLPQATSWLLSEASFVLHGEEEGLLDVLGESPHGMSVITISEDEEGGRLEQSSDTGDEPLVDEYEAFLARFLVLSPKQRKGDA